MGWKLDQCSPVTTSLSATSYNSDDYIISSDFHWMALCSLQSNLTTSTFFETLQDPSSPVIFFGLLL
jgi:hypothetical protein